ncbi:hypothetical protein ACLB2K_042077 [Fragaria x ananassa]
MKKTLNQVILLAASSNFSRQNQPSQYHLIHRLRDCKDSTSATSLHSVAIKSASLQDTFTANHLINCYVRLQNIDSAAKVFDEMPQPNVVSFTSLISGYVSMARPDTALWLFGRMLDSLVLPNEFTFATVTNSCSTLADLETGRKIHARIEILCAPRWLICTGSAMTSVALGGFLT